MRKVMNNFYFILRFSWKKEKLLGIVLMLEAFAQAVIPFILLYLLKTVVDGLNNNKNLAYLMKVILIYSSVYLLLFIMREWLSWLRTLKTMKAYDGFSLELAKKASELDLVDIENADTLNLFNKANDSIWYGSIGVFAVLVSLINTFLQLLGYIYLFTKINAWIISVFIITAIVHLIYERYKGKRIYENYTASTIYKRRAQYIADTMIRAEKGKDIRQYSASGMLINFLKSNNSSYLAFFQKNNLIEMKQLVLDNFLIFFMRLCTYIFFSFQFIKNHITIGDFSIFIIAIDALFSILLQIPSNFIEARDYSLRISDYIAFLEKTAKIQVLHKDKITGCDNFEIEFQNVSFRYPNSIHMAVENISFVIPYGQKLTIIGDNGSGKSTLFKLLLRLYDPTEGRILLNGIDIKKYSFNEYAKLFAPVFQDYQIFEFSIAENIALKGNINIDELSRINRVLQLVGLQEKIDNLPLKEQSNVFRSFDENGVILSKGEQQKLAVARSLFQNRPINMYDEPAAAMDPQSEIELYDNLLQINREKTTIFISHRMSSCKHADKVILMDRGSIAAIGTHEQLLKTNLLYKKMWDAQASHYIV